MMYVLLYQYLVQHKELPVPGIGTFLLERTPASIDFPNKKIYPPVYSVRLQHDSYVPGHKFFSWLAQALNLSDREAVFRFNDFAFDLKKTLSEGNFLKWNGVGELRAEENGEIVLQSSSVSLEQPLPAEKIVRERYEHKVLVGEEEKTSSEMETFLEQEDQKKINWWVYSLAIGILALMFIGWYLSEHGIEIFSIMNSTKLIPDDTPETLYKVLP